MNNAALYGDWDMGDQSFDYLKRVFDVNLHGVWLMTRAVAPHMVEQQYGRIVNQASAAAYNYRAQPGTAEFAASARSTTSRRSGASSASPSSRPRSSDGGTSPSTASRPA